MLFGFVCSAGLLGLLFYRYPLDAAYFSTLREARWWGVAGIVLSTALHCQLSAHKWRIVTLLGDPHANLGRGLFGFYSALIALLGQAMPLQVAVLAGRSLALRTHADIPMRRSVLGAIYDQGFDLLIPGLALLPAALFFFGMMGPAWAVCLFIFAVVLCGVLLRFWGERVIGRVLVAANAMLPDRLAQRTGLARMAASPPEHVGNRALFRLYSWSVFRFANLVLRAWLVAWCIRVNIGLPALLFGHCVVMFSVILNFVPGALGVAEWGWMGALNLAGVSSDDAMAYAVSSRLLIVLSLILVNLIWLSAMLLRGFKVRAGRSPDVM
ncbi:MAG: flippase-like domain-containing protein [Candidatus Hydrogenedentes bacterium]|nr:flippase-like domain-containing protein [Candidatus Hydrogenedentota bacterium]